LPDRESKQSFYVDKMPPPWDVMPCSAKRESDKIKLVKSTMKKKFEGTEEGKYFEWRPSVIKCIHKANIALEQEISIAHKIFGHGQKFRIGRDGATY
jgi:hypothetical protein